MKSFKEITADVELLRASYDKIKADMSSDMEKEDEGEGGEEKDEMKEKMMEMMDNVSSRINYIWDAIYQLDAGIYKHASKGHLPVLSAGQLQKILDKCGLADDFEVSKPTIYAKTSKTGTDFIVKLPIKK